MEATSPNGIGSRMGSARKARPLALIASIARREASSCGVRGISTGVAATSSATHSVSAVRLSR
jgi:hypothetical protein